MLEKVQSLVLRFFTIIRMFSFKQNCIRLVSSDPNSGIGVQDMVFDF